MGIFDSNPDEEVEISPGDDEKGDEGRLKDEVETEIVDGAEEKPEKSRNRRGKAIKERSRSKGKSSFKDEREISLEDIHKQNERIIELLEEITEKDDEEEHEMEGDLNGVL